MIFWIKKIDRIICHNIESPVLSNRLSYQFYQSEKSCSDNWGLGIIINVPFFVNQCDQYFGFYQYPESVTELLQIP
jgi:hypothetical protein